MDRRPPHPDGDTPDRTQQGQRVHNRVWCGRGRWEMKTLVDFPAAALIHRSESLLGGLGQDDRR